MKRASTPVSPTLLSRMPHQKPTNWTWCPFWLLFCRTGIHTHEGEMQPAWLLIESLCNQFHEMAYLSSCFSSCPSSLLIHMSWSVAETIKYSPVKYTRNSTVSTNIKKTDNSEQVSDAVNYCESICAFQTELSLAPETTRKA